MGRGLDISIQGDEQEQHRIQLEHNLQHTDISFHLSSTPDDYSDDDVEHPRHNSAPSPRSAGFASFHHLSNDDYVHDGHSHIHPWSFRSADDEDGINPYTAESMSTAAHHASALTINAGLAGRGVRRDMSMSGVEYDPDRPVHDMIAGIDSRFSAFDIDPSRSKQAAASINFDPLVVDDTGEIDRVLNNSYSATPRPKLSDALNRLAFSPKRPRSAQSHTSSSSSSRPQSPRSPPTQLQLYPQDQPSQRQQHVPSAPTPRRPSAANVPDYDIPTPRPASKLRYAQETPSQQKPRTPTPSSAKSEFTKLARGLARELEESRWDAAQPRPSPRQGAPFIDAPVTQSTVHDRRHKSRAAERNPLRDIVNAPPVLPTPSKVNKSLHLPDVTGLTSAVESPAKGGLRYYGYEDDEHAAAEAEARLLAVLNNVHLKLKHLEDENGISRRRVRELELELDECKQQVARERARVLDIEKSTSRQRSDKVRVVEATRRAHVEEQEENAKRYREAVEEKKALEALITTLRTNLARLTSELATHQRLLDELRTFRDSDASALKEKSEEVDRLRKEVERLAGEVEVLRGVVEEGLKERRMVRESMSLSYVTDIPEHSRANATLAPAPPALGQVVEEEGEDEEEGEEEAVVDAPRLEVEDHRIGEDEEEVSIGVQATMAQSSTSFSRRPDRTIRTDLATIQSTTGVDTSTRGFINTRELDRISVELEERRSERSISVFSHSQSSASSSRSALRPSRSPSPLPSKDLLKVDRSSVSGTSRFTRDDRDDGYASAADRSVYSRAESPAPSIVRSEPEPLAHSRRVPSTRPSAPTPARSTKVPGRSCPPATPFPQIRGTNLERLFFSAPEHNAKSCPVCHRRRRATTIDPIHTFDCRTEATTQEAHLEDDEGFGEGSDELGHGPLPSRHKGKGKQRSNVAFAEDEAPRKLGDDKLPPQTVLARVLRELEDDFTHYKGIYTELADQYKIMDAASDVAKRNVLAQHLREVIDVLEQKGDQIASLYDLLTFKDKPLSSNERPVPSATASWGRARGSRKQSAAS
ncbi:hypothetical protein JAAARDRAFT_189583 [Jaapia argillacea MUCL 33604]|uniref:Cep57 centrosome microtubule-binding domain-containing protein n=1 Tax=Jaapia argillacea MUCL 33604 TaxID=933084 RepID=A0A067QFE7_9AGAM|nr:hypothetical protein JAAARDRAFT_189583 [Jaapia argillacea MUCL 33604]